MLQLVPQIEPVTRLAREHKEVFQLLGKGPVILAQHSKAAAVLVGVETWNQTLRRLAYLERLAQGDQASAAIGSGIYDSEEDVDAGFHAQGLS